MEVLITGIGGMVGTHLTDLLWSTGIKPHGFFYNSTVPISEVGGKCFAYECDVRDFLHTYRLMEKIRPQVIYHLAAQSYPGVSWAQPALTLDINLTGTVNIFEAVKLIKVASPDYDPVIVVACSSAEYGASLIPEKTPIGENELLLPLSPYGVSKVGQDLLAYQYFMSSGLKSIRARIFNTTGPRKVGDAPSDFVRRALDVEAGRAGTLKVGNLTTRRAITDVRDLVKALKLLAEHGAPGEAYNISGQAVYSMEYVIETIQKLCHRPMPIEQDSALMRPIDEPVIWGDSTKLFKATGWTQEITLEKTIADMLDYWRNREGSV